MNFFIGLLQFQYNHHKCAFGEASSGVMVTNDQTLFPRIPFEYSVAILAQIRMDKDVHGIPLFGGLPSDRRMQISLTHGRRHA